MEKVLLYRMSMTEDQSLGILTTLQEDGNIFVARTLERPWIKNIHDISCIPAGRYICKWSRSTRLSFVMARDVFTYEVMNVPQRTGIRIHSANYWTQLSGCIALGSALKDINADSQLDTIHSGATVAEFNKIMGGKDFILEIQQ